MELMIVEYKKLVASLENPELTEEELALVKELCDLTNVEINSQFPINRSVTVDFTMVEACFKSLNTWRKNVATRIWKDVVITAGWQVAEDYENRYYVIEGKR